MPRVLPRRRPLATGAAAAAPRLCAAWHTALPTASQVYRQRDTLHLRRQADAVRQECDASRRVALAHSRDLQACLRQEDGRSMAEAWGLLRLLVETDEVNEYHFSLVLQDGCEDAEAVSRLEALMAETGIEPNHVLSTGLHSAWVEHGEYERAVGVLAAAHGDGRLRPEATARIALATLSQLTHPAPRGAGDSLPEAACGPADIMSVCTPWDYLRELYAVHLAEPTHFAVMLRLCKSADTIDLLLREMRAHGVAPDVHFYTTLHNAWLSVGEMGEAVNAIEEAREALSHDPASEETLSRTRSNAIREMLALDADDDEEDAHDGSEHTQGQQVSGWGVRNSSPRSKGRQQAWKYFFELQARGVADIFQYGVMAELACDSRQELFDLFHRKTLIPHAATYTTLHHVRVGLSCSACSAPRPPLCPLLSAMVTLIIRHIHRKKQCDSL